MVDDSLPDIFDLNAPALCPTMPNALLVGGSLVAGDFLADNLWF